MTGIAKRSRLLSIYQAGISIAAPLAPFLLKRRLARGKEDANRLGERLGRPQRTRPGSALVWLHAASVGESLSVLPLIAAILDARPDAQVMLTSGTVTSARLMAKRLPERAFHQFAPVDTPGAVRGFLDHWRPDLAIFVESEFWPNLILDTAARGIPMALINARMSDGSFRGWQRVRDAAGALLSAFSVCLAQDRAVADKLKTLGGRNVAVSGNLKLSADPLPFEPTALSRLTNAIGGRPVWVAASTHDGEEAVLVDIARALRQRFGELLTIVVPRHPERGARIAEMFRERNVHYSQRSLGHGLDTRTEFYLADTLGELGVFYRASRVSFLGGSLVPHGGQNPLEPARLGCAVLSGPHVGNFSEAYARLADAGAAEVLASPEKVQFALASLLADPERARAMGARGERVAGDPHALQATLSALMPYLKAMPHDAHA